MAEILIFAGTTEGRLLAEKAQKLGLDFYVSTATEYGREVLTGFEKEKVLSGRMDAGEIESFLKEKGIDTVMDATHPFARAVTENIKAACQSAGCKYLRCLREKGETALQEEQAKIFASVPETVEYLKNTKGNILIATGSKELREYTRIPGFKERCYVRVLSTLPSVEEAVRLGLEGKHLIAMQGPFSEEMNVALLHQVQATYFVTKESGKTGGFDEKLRAAIETGARLLVIGRPKEDGMSLSEAMKYLENGVI